MRFEGETADDIEVFVGGQLARISADIPTLEFANFGFSTGDLVGPMSRYFTMAQTNTAEIGRKTLKKKKYPSTK